MQASFDRFCGDDFILQYFFKYEHSLNKCKHVISSLYVQHYRTGSLSPDDDDDDDDPDCKTIL